jgi:hypothetical protein
MMMIIYLIQLKNLEMCGVKRAFSQEMITDGITDIRANLSVLVEHAKSQIKIALLNFYTHTHEKAKDALLYQIKPEKHLFVNRSFKINELRLVPFSPNLMLAKTYNEVPNTAVSLKPIEIMTHNRYPYIMPKVVPPSKLTDENFVVPFWFARPITDYSVGNTEISYHTAIVSVNLGGSLSFKTTIELPYLTNSQALEAGEEIVIYNETSKSVVRQLPAKRVMPKSTSEPGKRAKASK